MSNCRDCCFTLKNVCVNTNCEHYGVNYLTDYVSTDNCSCFVPLDEGLRPVDKSRNVAPAGEGVDEWFA